MHVAVRLFSNRSQVTSKCGKNNKVAHEAIAECVTDVLTTFWRLLWPIIEQTHGNIVFYIIKKQTTTEKLFFLFQTLSTWLPESSSNRSPKWRPKWRLPCWFRHVGSTKTLLCACSRVSQAFLPPVIVAFSNFSGVMWTENILSVF